MGSGNDRGAVTAEFMLLLPALVLIVAAAIGLYSLSLERLGLEVSAFQAARSVAIGLAPEIEPGLILEIEERERFTCVHIERSGLIPIRAEHCVIVYGG